MSYTQRRDSRRKNRQSNVSQNTPVTLLRCKFFKTVRIVQTAITMVSCISQSRCLCAQCSEMSQVTFLCMCSPLVRVPAHQTKMPNHLGDNHSSVYAQIKVNVKLVTKAGPKTPSDQFTPLTFGF